MSESGIQLAPDVETEPDRWEFSAATEAEAAAEREAIRAEGAALETDPEYIAYCERASYECNAEREAEL